MVLAYFYFSLSPSCQTKFLQFINQMRSSNDNHCNRNSYLKNKIWSKFFLLLLSTKSRHICIIYLHCLLGVAWIPLWNFYERFRRGVPLVSRIHWFTHILGLPPNMTEELGIWKLTVGCLMALARTDTQFLTSVTLFLLYTVTKVVLANASHLQKIISADGANCDKGKRNLVS